MPQFEASTFPTQIFWLLVCFIFLCIVMARFLVPRLLASLESRERRIQDDWAQANAYALKEQNLKEENQIHLTNARAQAHTLIHQTLQDAYHMKESRIAALDEVLLAQNKKKREDLEAQIHKIRQHMDPVVFQVVRETMPQIFGRTLPNARLKAVIQDVLKNQGPS